MGKLSDVIRHAGELSEETDDEDLWEDADEETEEDNSPYDVDSEEKNGEELLQDAETEETGSGNSPENADSEEKNGEELFRDAKTEEADDENFTEDAEAGETEDENLPESVEAEGTEEEDNSAEENAASAEENPECNEEGVPLKDVIYAENMRKKGKDLIVVQSVYDTKTIRDMLFRHAYLSTGGYSGLLLSLCAIGAAIYTYGRIQTWISLVLLVGGCMFVVIEPLLLRDRAKQMTRKGGIYHMPILFVLSAYGIELTRNGNHASHDWGDITRVTTTKYAVVMYKGKHTALVLTKKGIGDQKDQLYAMIRQRARNAKYMKLK